jgi:hypothetical protein
MPEHAPQRQRAYRPDFYTPENIIGYTGKLHESPTVYFQDGPEYGHITQQHDVADNIGRQLVGEEGGGWKYVIGDMEVEGVLRSVERLVHPTKGTRYFHVSRGQFIDCSRKGIDTFAILSQAIWRFQTLKRLDRSRLRAGRRWG